MEPKEVLAEAEVPDHRGWFVVGCRHTARVTLYTQQVRALNLAWALLAEGQVRAGTKIVVIGAGAAGLTISAALAFVGATVDVIEKKPDPIPLQRNCYKRHLHPRIYDWPHDDAKQGAAALPFLTWSAGMARDVAQSIEAGFTDVQESVGGRLNVFVDAENLELDVPRRGSVVTRARRWKQSSSPRREQLEYDLLVFAIGFGVEDSMWMGTRGSYWADDSLDQGGVFEPGEYLVSGTGDGGIIDVLRIAFRNFRQEHLTRVVEWRDDFPQLRAHLQLIEADARAASDEGSVLFTHYEKLKDVIPSAISELDNLIKEKFLNDSARVTLLCRGASPFSLQAASLHRLLLSRLYFSFPEVLDVRAHVELSESMLKPLPRSQVALLHGREAVFDHVIIRHGPKPAWKAFPELSAFGALPRLTSRELRTLYDRFEGFRGAPSGSGGAGPTGTAHSNGPTLDDYIDASANECSATRGVEAPFISLARFQNIAVELRAETKDSVDTSAEQAEATGEPAVRIGAMRYVQITPGVAVLPFELRPSGIDIIVGGAGTGKSTLLKQAVMGALTERMKDGRAPLPVYLRAAPTRSSFKGDEAFSRALAETALRSVGLDAVCRATIEIAREVRMGRAVLFIDNLEDWSRAHLDGLVAWATRARVRVLGVGRNSAVHATSPRDVAERTLVGLAPGDGVPFVLAHFKDLKGGDTSALSIVEELRSLPNGDEWVSSPFLLSRATQWLLEESGARRALNRLELYRRIVERGLARLPVAERSAIRKELTTLAVERVCSDMLQPSFVPERLNEEQQRLLLETHLVLGGETFEFAHLSIAEYIASCAPLELAAEREAARANPKSWQNNLDVLPFAHAQSRSAMNEAFAAAVSSDSDNRLLLLVLRAIAYGGKEVEAFCSEHRDALVAQVNQRLVTSSARFGETERVMMRAFERASSYLKGASVPELPGPAVGEVGAEHWTLQQMLATIPRSHDAPPGARYWSTIFCQARILLHLSPAELLTRTQGGDPWSRISALRTLAATGRAIGDVRALIHDRERRIRQEAVEALYANVTFTHRFVGLLADDEEWVRFRAVQALKANSAASWMTASRQTIVRKLLLSTESTLVKSELIALLPDDEASIDLALELFHQQTTPRDRSSSQDRRFLDALLERLSGKPKAKESIDEFIRSGRGWYCPARVIARTCEGHPERIEILATRLASDLPSHVEIEAAGEVGEPLRNSLRSLLSRWLTDPSRWHRVSIILGALPPGDAHSVADRLSCLDPRHIVGDDNDAVRKRRAVQIAAIRACDATTDYAALERMMASNDDHVVAAAIEKIGADPRMRAKVLAFLDAGLEESRVSSAQVLAAAAETEDARRALWTRFSALPATTFAVFNDGGASRVRVVLAKSLAMTRATDQLLLLVDDVNDYVRLPVIEALTKRPDDPSARAALEKRALVETEPAIRRLLWPVVIDAPSVIAHLQTLLQEDRYDIRQAYYLLLSGEPSRAEELRSHFRSLRDANAGLDDIIPAAARDRLLLTDLRPLLDHKAGSVRAAIMRTLVSDRTLRIRARQHLVDLKATQRLMVGFGEEFEQFFRHDMEAKATLTEGVRRGTLTPALEGVAPVLKGYKPARDVLLGLVDDPRGGDQVKRALADEPVVRDRLLRELATGDDHERRVAAEALVEVAEAQKTLCELIEHEDEAIRRVAYAAAIRERRHLDRLLERAESEKNFVVRLELLSELARIGVDGIDAVLMRRLANDREAPVRAFAASKLGGREAGHALRADETIRAVCTAPAASLIAFLGAPVTLREQDSPDLFAAVTAWLCAKLVSTLPEDGARMRTQVDRSELLFGELPVGSEVTNSRAVRVRLAMDHSSLARDRDVLPMANLVSAWDVASHLVASAPYSVIVACADAPFAALDYPDLDPGQLALGPTFFGFALHVA